MIEKPKQCFACKGTDFWYNKQQNTWVCNTCHNDPNPQQREIETLIGRCQKGLELLNANWKYLRSIVPEDDDSQKEDKTKIWKEKMNSWVEACHRLGGLVMQLRVLNFRKCLFEPPNWSINYCREREKQQGCPCWACPVNWEPLIFTAKPIEKLPESLFGKHIL